LQSSRMPLEMQRDLKRSVFISKISRSVSNSLLERLLKACGSLTSWKRSVADASRPAAFGVAEYASVESVFACMKTMSNLQLYENTIMVKADKRTQQAFDEWTALKKEEWITRQDRQGTPVDLTSLEQ
jgi:RNA-binding protein 25